MGLRFRRRVHIAPGVDLNLSGSGVGVSVGPRGAKASIGPRGTRQTVGIPGTGLSYTQTQSAKPQKRIGLVKALLSAFALAAILAVIGFPPDAAAWIAIVIAGLAWISGLLPGR